MFNGNSAFKALRSVERLEVMEDSQTIEWHSMNLEYTFKWTAKSLI